MSRIRLCLLFAGLSLAAGALAAGQKFPWDEFQPHSLRQVVASDLKTAEKYPTRENRMILSGQPVSSKATVVFTGNSRPLSRDRQALIERWALLKNAAKTFARQYEEEFLFVEGQREYWLAMQKQVGLQLVREAGKGKPVELYLLSGIGGVRTERGWDWLLLVVEYQIPK